MRVEFIPSWKSPRNLTVQNRIHNPHEKAHTLSSESMEYLYDHQKYSILTNYSGSAMLTQFLQLHQKYKMFQL